MQYININNVIAVWRMLWVTGFPYVISKISQCMISQATYLTFHKNLDLRFVNRRKHFIDSLGNQGIYCFWYVSATAAAVSATAAFLPALFTPEANFFKQTWLTYGCGKIFGTRLGDLEVRCEDLADSDRGDFRCRRAVGSSSYDCLCTIISYA